MRCSFPVHTLAHACRAVLYFLLSALVLAMPRIVRADTWAVLIGVSEYRYRTQITPLGGAANDARALKRLLNTRMGVPEDHIQLLVSEPGHVPTADEPLPDRTGILNAMELLRSRVRPDDTVWIFFAGHGISVKSQTFLLPYDASNLSSDSLVNTALKVSAIKGMLNGISARARILLFDMCRSEPRVGARTIGNDNPLTQEISRSLDFTPAPETSKSTRPPITVTLFACSLNQRSYEWLDKGRGYFSYFLEEGLGGKAIKGQKPVTVNALVKYVRENVSKAVAANLSAEQVPFFALAGANAGEYVLADAKPNTASWSMFSNPPPNPVQIPLLDTTNLDPAQSSRLGIYTNDPAITLFLNGRQVTSGEAHTEPVAAGTFKKFTYEIKSHDINSIGEVGISPGQTVARQVLRMRSAFMVARWPTPDEFLKTPAVSAEGDERTARKTILAGDWELADLKIRVVNTFTQTAYSARRSVPTLNAAHPDEPQQLVVAEARIKSKSKRKRAVYLVRVEGDDTNFPYDETALTDKNSAVYPLVAHDAETGDGLKLAFDGEQRRLVRWVFRVPRRATLPDFAQLRLSLLWTENDGQTPQRTLFLINLGGGKDK